MKTLEITDLSVEIENKKILNEFNLIINEGEIHAIMGPNGTGKSSLSKTIMGDSSYRITGGSIKYDQQNLEKMSTDERARLGIFLGMQMPLEIDGVTLADFLRTALHTKEGNNFNLMKFIKELDSNVEKLKMNKEMIHRDLNKGFSGGERKKNEILQMNLLKPSLIILDEIDSGLDIDALKLISKDIMNYYHEHKPAIILITHYRKLLEYIKPDYVHVLNNGHIIKSGDESIIDQLEKDGFDVFGGKNENHS